MVDSCSFLVDYNSFWDDRQTPYFPVYVLYDHVLVTHFGDTLWWHTLVTHFGYIFWWDFSWWAWLWHKMRNIFDHPKLQHNMLCFRDTFVLHIFCDTFSWHIFMTYTFRWHKNETHHILTNLWFGPDSYLPVAFIQYIILWHWLCLTMHDINIR